MGEVGDSATRLEGRFVRWGAVPSGWIGPGSVTVTEGELILAGKVRPKAGASVLGGIVGLVPAAAAVAYDLSRSTAAVIAAVGLVAGVAIAAMLARPRTRLQAIPWGQVERPMMSERATLAFRSKVAPRGDVGFVLADPARAAALAPRVEGADIPPRSGGAHVAPRRPRTTPGLLQALVALAIVGGAAVLVGLGVFPLWKPGPCTTHQLLSSRDGGRCVLTGTVEPVDPASAAINGYELNGAPLAQFFLRDDAGPAIVYYQPDEIVRPDDGVRVRIVAEVAKVKGSEIRRILAKDVELAR